MNPIHVSFVVACSALIAAAIGPFVSLAVSRRQFNASVLSANREKWITTLREMIAELISLLVAVRVIRAGWKGEWKQGHGAVIGDRDLLPKFERIVLVHWNIRLLTNPEEPDHLALCRAIDAARKKLQLEDAPDALTEADIETIARTSQIVLKQAWRRVKSGT